MGPNGVVIVLGIIFVVLFVASHSIAITLCARSGKHVAMWTVFAAGVITIAAAIAGIGSAGHQGVKVFERPVWTAVVIFLSLPVAIPIAAVLCVGAYYLCGRKVGVALSVGSSFFCDIMYLFSQFAEMH